jgi:cysteinyl-tRNA synthetase
MSVPLTLPVASAGAGSNSPVPFPVVLELGGSRLRLLDRARIYACGITPYDVTHLGHAATFLWVDTLARVLRSAGVEVELCRNVTDVDDVLDAAAARAGAPSDAFAAMQQFQFDQDMARLGVRQPAHEPRAHRYVAHVVRLCGALLDANAAYVRDGSVYFRGSATPQRAGLDEQQALALAQEFAGRPDDPAKDSPLDVAVWQASSGDEPAWQSPWGAGRPGWHAECAAMAMSVFGSVVDVHAGGADLRFPHHAYQAAMTEEVTGVAPYARGWLHAGVVTVDGHKMAKSAGNLVLVADLLERWPAAAVRLLVIDRPWAQSWNYSAAAVDAAAARLERLYAAAGRPGDAADATAEVARALLADLDVPAALAVAEQEGGAAARLVVSVLGLGGA